MDIFGALNIPSILQKFPRHFRNSLDISKNPSTFPRHSLDIPSTFPRHSLDVSSAENGENVLLEFLLIFWTQNLSSRPKSSRISIKLPKVGRSSIGMGQAGRNSMKTSLITHKSRLWVRYSVNYPHVCFQDGHARIL